MLLVTWKLTKILGVSLFAAGLFAAFFSHKPKQRGIAAYVVATLGLSCIWIAGYGMMKLMNYKMSASWISASILLSLVALGAALEGANNKSWRPWLGAVAAVCYGGSLVFMTLRTMAEPHLTLAILLPILAGLSFFGLRYINEAQEEDRQVAQKTATLWFRWVARLEGMSLLVLFGIYMPLKYGAGIVIDGGQGWVGWAHGIFQLVYVMGLIVTARLLGWSITRGIIGFVASLVPFGTFVFERKITE